VKEEITIRRRKSRTLMENDISCRLFSPIFIRVIKSGCMRWTGHIIYIQGVMKITFSIFVGNLKKTNHFGYFVLDGKMKLH